VFAYDPSEWSDLFVATAGASAALAGLVPGQSNVALGVELLVVGFVIGGTIFRLPTVRSDVEDEPRIWLWSRWGVRLTAVVPLVVAGASLLGESGGGLYWLAAGIAFAIAGAIANAWVLLVEILR
jgi:hypothetical protein